MRRLLTHHGEIMNVTPYWHGFMDALAYGSWTVIILAVIVALVVMKFEKKS